MALKSRERLYSGKRKAAYRKAWKSGYLARMMSGPRGTLPQRNYCTLLILGHPHLAEAYRKDAADCAKELR